MIDFFSIFTTTGLVLWSKTFCEIVGKPINNLIKNVILAEKTNEKQYIDDQYILKWCFNNDLGIVFVVGYQRILQLSYIDDLLASVKRVFTATYEKEFPAKATYLLFVSFYFLVLNSNLIFSLIRFLMLPNRFPIIPRNLLSYKTSDFKSYFVV
jgi:hypothetical protein